MKKGFTLVELLAVIAILAILVLIAMPNVLDLFNQSKVNTFVTEVQKIMDTAIVSFTYDTIYSGEKTIYYSTSDNASLKTSKLDLSAANKHYFIEMDRNGNFKRVVVYDSNYCYDVYTTYGGTTKGDVSNTKSILINGKIDKNTVIMDHVWESGNDSVVASVSGDSYRVLGCQANNIVSGGTGNNSNNGGGNNTVTLDTFILDGVSYDYEPGMTWHEWATSQYNTNLQGFEINGDVIYFNYNNSQSPIYFYEYNYSRSYGILSTLHVGRESYLNDEIVRGMNYTQEFRGNLEYSGSGLNVGDKYYDLRAYNQNTKYDMEYTINDVANFGDTRP